MEAAFDSEAFEQAVADLRFDEADRLVRLADPPWRESLRSRIEQGRDEAYRAAQERYRRVTDLGEAEDQEAVAGLASDPTTSRLLDLLPDSARRRAEAYLSAARRWEAGRRRTSERRLGEAHRALQDFDLELARGLARRVERRFLTNGEDLDRLLMDIEARAMEFESLREAQRRLPDRGGGPRRRSWWRRGGT